MGIPILSREPGFVEPCAPTILLFPLVRLTLCGVEAPQGDGEVYGMRSGRRNGKNAKDLPESRRV